MNGLGAPRGISHARNEVECPKLDKRQVSLSIHQIPYAAQRCEVPCGIGFGGISAFSIDRRYSRFLFLFLSSEIDPPGEKATEIEARLRNLVFAAHVLPRSRCQSANNLNPQHVSPGSPPDLLLRGKAIFRQVRMAYSVRSAFIGSIDAARRAGKKQAARATSIRRTQTVAMTIGSVGLT